MTNKLHTQSKRPAVVIDKRPENNVIYSYRNKHDPMTVPGNASYSGITKNGKQIAIFGDSLVKNILGHKISKDIKHGKVRVKPFLGAMAKEVEYHIKPELEKNNYDAVVICAGTNNIPGTKSLLDNNKLIEQSADEIAKDVIHIGQSCRDSGINNVYISLLTVREGYEARINEVNTLLKEYCRAAHFYYIDHSNIKLFHLSDGLHIKFNQIHRYANNISQILNT